MKHPAEERASKRSQEDGEGTSSTGGGQSARQLKLASCTGRKLKSSQQMSPNKM